MGLPEIRIHFRHKYMDNAFYGFWSLNFLAGTLNILAIFWDDHKNLFNECVGKCQKSKHVVKKVTFLVWMNGMEWKLHKRGTFGMLPNTFYYLYKDDLLDDDGGYDIDE